jgi:transposase
MSSYEVVVGVDVAKDSVSVAILKGTSHLVFSCENDGKKFEKELKKVLEKVEKEKMIVVMESTGIYHLKLAFYLNKEGYFVSVVNPFVIKKFAEMRMKRAKTDSVDAKVIAEYGVSVEELKLFAPKKEVQYEMEVKLKTIDDFYKQINALNNQIEALGHLPVNTSSFKCPYKRVIQMLTKEIKKIEKELIELAMTFYEDEYRILRSIPGVGNRLSCIIVSILHNFDSFANGKQVASYLGICPSPYESGSSVKRKGRIMKKGSPYLRKILYMCALPASRYNIGCKMLYERLVSKGKAKKVALVAVANKLIKQAFACLKSGKPYDQNYAFLQRT